MLCSSVYMTGKGTYRLYETDLPEELFRGFSLSCIEYMAYDSLDGIVETMTKLMCENDSCFFYMVGRSDDQDYSLTVIGGARHITDYVLKGDPVCDGPIEEVVLQLQKMPFIERKDRSQLTEPELLF